MKKLSKKTTAKVPDKPWYDIVDDWGLIESSFQKQYGIRLRGNNMPFSEFQHLISGLMPDTPLGNIISIRSEEDKERLKGFTPSMYKERQKWRSKLANDMLDNPESLDNVFKQYEKMCEQAYS